MSLLDDLIAAARADATAAGEPTFTVQRGADEPRQTQAVFAWFAHDETRARLRLAVDGTLVGVLLRDDVLGLVGTLERGGGSADHLFLPGDPADAFVEVHCGAPGCPRSWVVAGLAAAQRLRCEDHPAVAPRVGA